jgi:hypothetical protein
MNDAIPMGRLDTIDIAGKKLTIQTEFFGQPVPRGETKVYLGGALKKVYACDLASFAPAAFENELSRFHQEKMDEIVAGLKRKLES